jgi:hypothetical protein
VVLFCSSSLATSRHGGVGAGGGGDFSSSSKLSLGQNVEIDSRSPCSLRIGLGFSLNLIIRRSLL